MRFTSVVGVALLIALAGCAGLGGDAEPESRFLLVVQNDGSTPMTVHVVVTDAEGTVIAEETDELDTRVGRSFDLTIDGVGTHEVVVTGDDWASGVRVNPATCEAHEATISLSDGRLESVTECVALR